jgi:hypothetical protein
VNTDFTLSPTSFLGERISFERACRICTCSLGQLSHYSITGHSLLCLPNDMICPYANRLFICQAKTSRQTAVTILYLLSKRLWSLCLASHLPTIGGKQKSTTYLHNLFFLFVHHTILKIIHASEKGFASFWWNI